MIMDFIPHAKAGHGGAVVMKLEWGQRKGERTDHELRG